MRNLFLLFMLIATQPAYAATHSFDFEMTYDREYFVGVFDTVTNTPMEDTDDGGPLGLSGPFSGMTSGDAVSASVVLEEQFGEYQVTSCVFADQKCGGEFVELDPGKSLAILGFFRSYVFDLEAGKASFFLDGSGQSATGSFQAYGAEFNLVETPVPFSAALLLSGFALLGLTRRRRT